VVHCDGGFAEASRVVESLARLPHSSTHPLILAYVSVVPQVDRAWRAFAKAHGLAFRQVTYRYFATKKGEKIPFSNSNSKLQLKRGGKVPLSNSNSKLQLDYPKPETIGADRLADAAGAVSRYGAPVLVMDFGTALTAAVVTRDRVWRGGVIAPGFPLMRDYLYERTAKLPRMKLGGKCPRIGRSTEEAMRFGAYVGYRGMVREIVGTLADNFSTDFRLVATGGFAKWVLKDSGMPFTVDATLTLHGAGLLASRSPEVLLSASRSRNSQRNMVK
jgi:type III pantothenate kinase